MMNKNPLNCIDHTSQCCQGATCDCPTFGETIAELEQMILDAASQELPSWLTDADRPSLIAETRALLVRTMIRAGISRK